MKTKAIVDKEGHSFAFEVENAFLTRREVHSIFRKIPGAAHVKYLKDDEFCECTLNGKRFVAFEAYGDNSVFWIGPSPAEWNPDIKVIREIFQSFRPMWGVVRWLFILVPLIAVALKFFATNS